jgi:hypothetical protein
MYALDATSALRSEASEDRGAVAPPCLDSLEVGLDTCTTAGIAP